MNASVQRNLSIDTAWFDNPVRKSGETEVLMARIRNTGSSAYEDIPVRLTINGKQRALTNVSIPANAAEQLTFKYLIKSSGKVKGEISVEDFPMTFDNTYRFSYIIPEEKSVLYIFETTENKAFERLFKPDNYFDFRAVSLGQLDYQSIESYDLIICDELSTLSSGLVTSLKNAMHGGNNVAIIPGTKTDNDNYSLSLQKLADITLQSSDTGKTSLSKLSFSDPFFSGVFTEVDNNTSYPYTKKLLEPIDKSGLALPLIRTDIGKNALLRKPIGNGSFFILGTPLKKDVSNFAQHALFVPTFYQMALFASSQPPIAYTQGQRISISLLEDFQESPPHITGEGVDLIPRIQKTAESTQLYVEPFQLPPGYYDITTEGNAQVFSFAMNTERQESDLSNYSPNDITDFIEEKNLENVFIHSDSNQAVIDAANMYDSKSSLWYWALVLTVVIILLESVLLKFWK